MPRDLRPYLTYPLGYTSHPRWELLSDAAFRALHEMQDIMRQHGMDGRMLAAQAEKKWRKKVLDELVKGIDDRPLLVRDGDAYVMRSYAEHQFTTADAEKLRKDRAEAGRAGGRAKAANAKQRLAGGVASATDSGWQNVPMSESESEVDVNYLSRSGSGSNARDAMPDRIQLAHDRAEALGIRDLASVREMLERAAGEPVSLLGAVELVRAVLSSAVSRVRDVDAYVATACRNSAAEIQRAYFDLDIEGAA